MSSSSLAERERSPSQIKRGPVRRGLSRKHREWIAAYLFLAPDLMGLFVFLGIPMLLAFAIGFFEADGFGNFAFVGLDNYRQMFSDPHFLKSLQVTVAYVFGYVPCLFITSLLLALLLKQKIPFIGTFRTLFFIPNVVSLVVVGFVWKFLLADQIGVLNQLLQGGARSWLGDPNLALGGVIVVSVWFSMGYYMVIFLAGLQEIPAEYYDAASIDGADAWATFWYVTWPLLRPTSFFVLLVTLISAAGGQGFDLIFVMTRGGPAEATSLGIFYIYQQAF